jgi:CheY-like chemotaxis protein
MTTNAAPAVQLPVMLVAEVQDSLLVVVHDLSRLDGLLAHTMENLMERFTSASANLADPALMDSRELDGVRSTLRAAVTELQFQDMASQLISHTSKILQGCAYRLASESMGSEDGEAVPFVDEVPERPNPVTQDEMDAGSIELF